MERTLPLWRRAAAEGLAACALVFAGCSAIIADQSYQGALGAVGISLVFGLIIMVMRDGSSLGRAHQPLGHDRRHRDPALLPRDALVYIAAQLTGATAGALVLARRVAWSTCAPGRDRPNGRSRQRVRV